MLFLGNVGKHHDSGKYAPWLAISLFKQGINLTYTTDLNDLNAENLSHYDGLIIYANHDVLSPTQEQAMKDFVEGGKGLIPLHSASGLFQEFRLVHQNDWRTIQIARNGVVHDVDCEQKTSGHAGHDGVHNRPGMKPTCTRISTPT